MATRNDKTSTPPAGPEYPHDDPQADRIISAARRIFLANGFRSVTMDDLARELGMSKRTLYGRFPSKLELVRAVLLQKLAEAEADLARAVDTGQAGATRTLADIMATVHGHLAEISPAFARDLRRDAPEVFEAVRARRRAMLRGHLGALIEQGQRRGMVRDDMPAALILSLVGEILDAVVTPAKVDELNMAPRELLEQTAKILLGGLLTERGRRER